MTVQAVAGKTCIYTHDNNVGSHSPHTGLFREACYGLTRGALAVACYMGAVLVCYHI